MLYTDPLGLDVGQPESTTARAQEDMAYEAARNEWSKDEGNWVTGCLAAEADNWRHIDSAAFNSAELQASREALFNDPARHRLLMGGPPESAANESRRTAQGG